MLDNTLNKLTAAVAKDMSDNSLQKTLTTSSNEVNYDLQRPAKDLFPVITPLRNRIPRVSGNGGVATHWKSIYGITAGNPGSGFVPEGVRAPFQNTNAIDVAASYRTLGNEDVLTEEALNAAQGFEDLFARMNLRILEQTMILEEFAILGGNADVSLAAPGTIVTSAPAVSGTSLPATTYYVAACALTMTGYQAAGEVTGAAAGVTILQTTPITSADGTSFNYNSGSSQLSSIQSQVVGAGDGLGLTVPVVPGAVAYAWFIGTTTGAANLHLEFITTINSLLVSTPLAGTGQLASTITVNATTNPNLDFDGLFYTAVKSGSGAYYSVQATGTAGSGTPLTAGSHRNIVEIDVALKSMWDAHRLSPTVILVNSQELQNMTAKVMNTSSTVMVAAENGNIQSFSTVANGVVTGYFNPFCAGGVSVTIPIILHPNLPAGTILFWCENLPSQYKNNQTPNVAEMHVRKEYVSTVWPRITRNRSVGVYVEETLAVYAPFGLGVITNIGNG